MTTVMSERLRIWTGSEKRSTTADARSETPRPLRGGDELSSVACANAGPAPTPSRPSTTSMQTTRRRPRVISGPLRVRGGCRAAQVAERAVEEEERRADHQRDREHGLV